MARAVPLFSEPQLQLRLRQSQRLGLLPLRQRLVSDLHQPLHLLLGEAETLMLQPQALAEVRRRRRPRVALVVSEGPLLPVCRKRLPVGAPSHLVRAPVQLAHLPPLLPRRLPLGLLRAALGVWEGVEGAFLAKAQEPLPRLQPTLLAGEV